MWVCHMFWQFQFLCTTDEGLWAEMFCFWKNKLMSCIIRCKQGRDFGRHNNESKRIHNITSFINNKYIYQLVVRTIADGDTS